MFRNICETDIYIYCSKFSSSQKPVLYVLFLAGTKQNRINSMNV